MFIQPKFMLTRSAMRSALHRVMKLRIAHDLRHPSLDESIRFSGDTLH